MVYESISSGQDLKIEAVVLLLQYSTRLRQYRPCKCAAASAPTEAPTELCFKSDWRYMGGD